MFTKRESIALLISAIALAFVFGFDDDNLVFVFSEWFVNFLGILLLVAIAILFRELVIKIFAGRNDAKSEYQIWNIKRVWFKHELGRGLPLGLIIALLGAIVSAGKFFFTAIGMHYFKEIPSARVGRKHPTLQYYEEAQIASMGILASLFLAIIGLLLGNIFDVNMNSFVTINFYITLFNLLPLSELDGAKIFFGSLLTYIFLVVFVVIAFLLIKSSVIGGLIIAFLIACVATMAYFYTHS